MPPSWADRVQSVWERIEVVSATFDILRSIVTERAEWFASSEIVRDTLVVEVQRLCELPIGDKDGLELCEELETHVESAERSLLSIDAELPMQTYRRRFDRFFPNDVLVLRYATLLSYYLADAVERQDRFEFLVTRLLTKKARGGGRRMVKDEQITPVVEAIVGLRASESETRDAALKFFADAHQRLEQFTVADELFDSGFYIDVRGYKYTLRGDMIDREILPAAVALNAAISRRLAEFQREQRFREGNVNDRLTEQEQRLRYIFHEARALEDSVAPRFENLRAVTFDQAKLAQEIKEQDGKPKPKKPRKTRVKAGPAPKSRFGFGRKKKIVASERYRRWRGASSKLSKVSRRARLDGDMRATPLAKVAIWAGGFGIAIALSFALQAWITENELQPLDGPSLAKISTVLASGSTSVGKSDAVFIGKVDIGEWSLLTAKMRNKRRGPSAMA